MVSEVAAREPTWEVDAVSLPIGIADGASHRPVAVLVTADEFVIRSEVRDRLGGEAEDVAEAFEREIVRAAHQVGSFPERVVIRYPEVVEPLRMRLAPRAVAVDFAAVLPNLEDAARSLIEHMSGLSGWPPVAMADTWAAWRLPPATVRDLFRAAADFWRSAPWTILSNNQAPEATFPSGRVWTAGVMGDGGQQFGLALYSLPDDLYSLGATEDHTAGREMVRGRIIGLTFDPVAELPRALTLEARVSGWKIAGPKAFPVMVTINTPGGGVSKADMEDLTALLHAIPLFAEAHADVFRLEQHSGVPARPVEWRDDGSGAVLRYDGDLTQKRMAEADLRAGSGPSNLVGEDEAALQLELDAIIEAVTDEYGPDADVEDVLAEVTGRASGILAKWGAGRL